MSATDALNSIMSDFSKKAVGLLTVTNKELFPVHIYDKTVFYGKMYAKPSKRLARLLTIDSEILVLVSAFKEQQFRTIAQIRDIIEHSDGRLEQTVAILIHREHAGENKIKKWGTQQGITVLPIYYDENFPEGDQLENYLLSELFSHDLFDITGPVSDDAQFYGRKSEALDLARKLNSGQIRSYLGIRKIGKTSVLNRSIFEAQKHYAANCIVIDCSKDSIWSMNASQLMTSILEAVIQNIQENSTRTVSPSKRILEINDATDKLLNEINLKSNSIILFFDEVDYITPGSPTGTHWKNDFNIFWRNLRAVYQDTCRYNHNLGIFVSGVSSKWFSVESIEGVENAALAFVPEEYLSPMSKTASEQMIKKLARTSGLQFEEPCEDIISDFCSNIPYWIRKACSYIHRNTSIQDRPCTLDILRVNLLLQEFLEQEGGVLSRVAIMHLLKVFPELQDVTIKVFKNDFKDCPKIYLNILERYGVIKSNPFSISGEMMKEGIKLFVDIVEDNSFNKTLNESIINTPVKDRLAFETYDEWADELAILNRDRNLLEKKLRSIAVNFIRMDSLNNKAKLNVTERVLRVIETSRRGIYTSLNPEQIIEKFNWTDLTKLIEKEWSTFEKLFNDKVHFQLQAKTINERLDAHAKDADKADIAMQRNAIKWFDDKLRAAS